MVWASDPASFSNLFWLSFVAAGRLQNLVLLFFIVINKNVEGRKKDSFIGHLFLADRKTFQWQRSFEVGVG